MKKINHTLYKYLKEKTVELNNQYLKGKNQGASMSRHAFFHL